MFGSLVAMQTVYETLRDVPDITAAVDTRLFGMTVVPEGVALPACLYYPVVPGQYSGPLNGEIDAETLQLDVKFQCVGASADPITAAVNAALTALNGLKTVTGGYSLTFYAVAEIPFLTLVEEGAVFTQLGVTVQVEIYPGG